MPGRRASCQLMMPLVIARLTLCISQHEVAQKLGVSQAHISDIESGVVSPRVSELARYAEVVEMTFTPFFHATLPEMTD